MTITIYKDVLYRRMQSLQPSLGKNNNFPTLSSITQLDATSQKLPASNSEFSKPIKRPKASQSLSLYLIEGVPQVKAAKLGLGAFARTYLHVDGLPNKQGETDADHIYAVKVFHTSGDHYNEDIKTEIEISKKLGRYIRSGMRVCGKDSKGQERRKHYVVVKYIPGENLHEKLNKNIGFTTEIALKLMVGICEDVKSLHDLGYTHGDLSTRNIMITPELKPVVIDFNYSRPFGTRYYFGFGKDGKPGINSEYRYIAPECRDKEYIQFTVPSDIYAIGYLMIKILENTRCNAATREAIQSYIDDMRMDKPSDRPDLDMVTKSLKAMQNDPGHAQVSRRRVNRQMKIDVINSLKSYQTNLASYFTALVDSEHREKEECISSLVEKLNDINIREDFLHTLKEGFMHYFTRFVANNLEKYIKLENLGRGLECFTTAIKACGIEIDVDALINEVKAKLPKDSPQSPEFADRLSGVFSPRSNTPHSKGTIYVS
jgi:serine/threonine protein kinase